MGKNIEAEREFVSCNLCGSDSYIEKCFYNEIRIVQCKICGLVYRNPRLKENQNREFYSLDYYGEYEGMEERISNARLSLFNKILASIEKRVVSEKRSILDVGCGQGHFLKMAKDNGWDVVGVELAASACEYGKSKFGINIINKGIEEAHFNSNSFDAITLWNVLDHLLDPLATLREINRILKPGGQVIIRVPNVKMHLFIHKIFVLLDKFIKQRNMWDPSVVINYGFSDKTISNLLKRAGLKKVKVLNSPVSSGDPYKSFKSTRGSIIDFIKKSHFIFSQIIYFISFGKFLLGTALLIFAEK